MKHSVLHIIFAILLSFSVAKAQVSVSIDTNSIQIGEAVEMTVNLSVPENTDYNFPSANEGFLRSFNLIRSVEIDTLCVDNDIVSLELTYLFTSLNSGSVSFEAGPFFIGKKSYSAEEFTLEITLPEVDMQGKIKDVKPPIGIEPKSNFWLIFWIVVGVIVLVVLGYFAYKKFKPKYLDKVFKQTEVILPADELALNKIEELQQKELWKQGAYKQHYTILNDILREYFSATIGISVFERTNEEIIQDVAKSGKMEASLQSNMAEMLRYTDLVKFAKQKASESNVYIHIGVAKACVEGLRYCIVKEKETNV